MTPVNKLLSLADSSDMETNGRGVFKESCDTPFSSDCAERVDIKGKASKINANLRLKKENACFKKIRLVCLLLRIYNALNE